MAKRGLMIVLPGKTFRLSSTWVAERDGTEVRLWASPGDHQRGARAAVHAQRFGDEWEAQGAHHLLTEAAFYANACGDGRVDLRDFCFWGGGSEGEPPDEGPAEVERPRPEGITLSSLFTRKRT